MKPSPEGLRNSGERSSFRTIETAIIVGLLLFALLVLAVSNGWTDRFDHAALLALRHDNNVSVPLGPSWLIHAFVDITGLGSSFVLGVIAAVIAGYLFLVGKTSDAVFLLMSAIGAWCLFNIVKLAVGRPRPDIGMHIVPAGGLSFPSGHATDSSATYLALALLFAASQSSSRVRAYGYGLAILMIGLIGASRVYLGVHYPVDVLAGWCCGPVWVLACRLVTRRLTPAGPRK